MCPKRIYEQYQVAINEKDDAILSIIIHNEVVILSLTFASWIEI